MPPTEEPDIHLGEIIAKFYNIGQQRYNGKVFDNVLNIFDDLELYEQKVLLRGSLGTYSSLTSVIIHEREVIDSGDAGALLSRLKQQRLDNRKPLTSTIKKDDEDEKKEPPKEQTTDLKEFFDSPAGGMFRVALLFIGFFILIHISMMAVSDDPNSMQGAKIYQNFIDVIGIFVEL